MFGVLEMSIYKWRFILIFMKTIYEKVQYYLIMYGKNEGKILENINIGLPNVILNLKSIWKAQKRAEHLLFHILWGQVHRSWIIFPLNPNSNTCVEKNIEKYQSVYLCSPPPPRKPLETPWNILGNPFWKPLGNPSNVYGNPICKYGNPFWKPHGNTICKYRNPFWNPH